MPMREAVDEAAARVREGAGIAAALERSGYFPPMTVHLIASGETGGRLEEMLTRTANYQEKEVDGLIATLLGILQPLLIDQQRREFEWSPGDAMPDWLKRLFQPG